MSNGTYRDGKWFCRHDQEAIWRTSRQPHSDGRRFLRCSVTGTDQCNFFVWEEDLDNHLSRLSLGSQTSTPRRGRVETPRTPESNRSNDINAALGSPVRYPLESSRTNNVASQAQRVSTGLLTPESPSPDNSRLSKVPVPYESGGSLFAKILIILTENNITVTKDVQEEIEDTIRVATARDKLELQEAHLQLRMLGRRITKLQSGNAPSSSAPGPIF